MTIGRTSTGAIKIKTDGGLRAVNCACCGGDCACGSARPINPPSDPDFTKKLHGDDPSVTPFTQVTINYNVSSEITASGTVTGTWVDGSDCDVKKVLGPISGASYFWGGCGYMGYVSGPSVTGQADIQIVLSNDGCLTVLLLEHQMLEGIKLAGAGDNIYGFGIDDSGFDGNVYTTDCSVDDGTGTITIQGVAYPTVRVDYWGSPISGALDITFS